MEVIDPDTRAPLPDGREGNICTTLALQGRHLPLHPLQHQRPDLVIVPGTDASLGLRLRRMTGFHGRSDNMVKLRGINVYPVALGGILPAEPETTGEFVCRVDRVGPRDEMTVLVEVQGGRARARSARRAWRELLPAQGGRGDPVECVDARRDRAAHRDGAAAEAASPDRQPPEAVTGNGSLRPAQRWC